MPQTAIDAAVGRNVAKYRKEVGITKQELAQRCGLRLADVVAAEAGERRFGSRELFLISAQLRRRVSDLLVIEDLESEQD